MQAAFDECDLDARGVLAFAEVKRALRSLGVEVSSKRMKKVGGGNMKVKRCTVPRRKKRQTHTHTNT